MLSLLLDNHYGLNFSVSLTEVLIFLISALIVIFLTMPIHEYAHARIAVALGDNTPRYNGRVSLNPFNHIDWIGAASIIALGIGWAKPVGVNMRNFKNPKLGMALVALAGPLSNLLLALVSLLLYNFCMYFAFSYVLTVVYFMGQLFLTIAVINISLAVFNLLPIPPLDGSRILNIILPDRIYYSIMRYEQFLSFAVLFLVFSGALDVPLEFAKTNLLILLDNIAVLPLRLFGLI